MLRAFRLTVDYPARTAYWYRETAGDPHDLEYVGLTLRADHGEYFVAGIATRNGTPTVTGVQPGDKVLRIGGGYRCGARPGKRCSQRYTGVEGSGGR